MAEDSRNSRGDCFKAVLNARERFVAFSYPNLSFDGRLGTQTTFTFGTAEDVREKVRELCEELDALNGGLTLSPTHILEPEVPPENVVAFFEACDEFGGAGKEE